MSIALTDLIAAIVVDNKQAIAALKEFESAKERALNSGDKGSLQADFEKLAATVKDTNRTLEPLAQTTKLLAQQQQNLTIAVKAGVVSAAQAVKAYRDLEAAYKSHLATLQKGTSGYKEVGASMKAAGSEAQRLEGLVKGANAAYKSDDLSRYSRALQDITTAEKAGVTTKQNAIAQLKSYQSALAQQTGALEKNGAEYREVAKVMGETGTAIKKLEADADKLDQAFRADALKLYSGELKQIDTNVKNLGFDRAAQEVEALTHDLKEQQQALATNGREFDGLSRVLQSAAAQQERYQKAAQDAQRATDAAEIRAYTQELTKLEAELQDATVAYGRLDAQQRALKYDAAGVQAYRTQTEGLQGTLEQTGRGLDTLATRIKEYAQNANLGARESQALERVMRDTEAAATKLGQAQEKTAQSFRNAELSRFTTELKSIEQAQKAGAISAEQAASAVSRLQAGFKDYAAGLGIAERELGSLVSGQRDASAGATALATAQERATKAFDSAALRQFAGELETLVREQRDSGAAFDDTTRRVTELQGRMREYGATLEQGSREQADLNRVLDLSDRALLAVGDAAERAGRGFEGSQVRDFTAELDKLDAAQRDLGAGLTNLATSADRLGASFDDSQLQDFRGELEQLIASQRDGEASFEDTARAVEDVQTRLRDYASTLDQTSAEHETLNRALTEIDGALTAVGAAAERAATGFNPEPLSKYAAEVYGVEQAERDLVQAAGLLEAAQKGTAEALRSDALQSYRAEFERLTSSIHSGSGDFDLIARDLETLRGKLKEYGITLEKGSAEHEQLTRVLDLTSRALTGIGTEADRAAHSFEGTQVQGFADDLERVGTATDGLASDLNAVQGEVSQLGGDFKDSGTAAGTAAGDYERVGASARELDGLLSGIQNELQGIVGDFRETGQGATVAAGDLSRLADVYVQLEGAATRTAAAQAKGADSFHTENVRQQIAALNDLKLAYEKGDISQEQFVASAKQIDDALTQARSGLEANTRAYSGYTGALSKVESSLAQAEGRVTKFGVASGVTAGISDQLQNVLYTLGPAGEAMGVAMFSAGAGMEGASVGAKALNVALAVGLVGAIVAAAVGIGNVVKQAYTLDTGLTDVAKTTSFTRDQLGQLAGSLQEISRNTGTPIKDLTDLAAVAGSLGITGVKNVAQFTDVINKLQVATDIIGREGAEQLAKFVNVTKDAKDSVGDSAELVANVIVRLGNTLATTEAPILKMAQNLASLKVAAGVSQPDILGLAGAFVSLGIKAELGGTNVVKIFSNMSQAASTGGQALQVFADAAGVTTDEFARLVKEQPADAFIALVAGIREAKDAGQDINPVIADITKGNNEMRTVLLAAVGGFDTFSKAVSNARDEAERMTALNNELNTRLDSLRGTTDLIGQSFAYLRDSLALKLIPALQGSLTGVLDFIRGLSGLEQTGDRTITTATKIGEAFRGVATGFNDLPTSVKATVTGIATAGTALIGLSTAMKVAGIASGALRLAMLPLLAPPTGIILLGAAAAIGLGVALGQLRGNFNDAESGSRQALTGFQNIRTSVDEASAAIGTASDKQALIGALTALGNSLGGEAKAQVKGFTDQLEQTGGTIDDLREKTEDFQRSLEITAQLQELRARLAEIDQQTVEIDVQINDDINAQIATFQQSFNSLPGVTTPVQIGIEVVNGEPTVKVLNDVAFAGEGAAAAQGQLDLGLKILNDSLSKATYSTGENAGATNQLKQESDGLKLTVAQLEAEQKALGVTQEQGAGSALKLGTAQQEVERAIANMSTATTGTRAEITAYLERLEAVAKKYPEVAASIQPFIDQSKASLTLIEQGGAAYVASADKLGSFAAAQEKYNSINKDSLPAQETFLAQLLALRDAYPHVTAEIAPLIKGTEDRIRALGGEVEATGQVIKGEFDLAQARQTGANIQNLAAQQLQTYKTNLLALRDAYPGMTTEINKLIAATNDQIVKQKDANASNEVSANSLEGLRAKRQQLVDEYNKADIGTAAKAEKLVLIQAIDETIAANDDLSQSHAEVARTAAEMAQNIASSYQSGQISAGTAIDALKTKLEELKQQKADMLASGDYDPADLEQFDRDIAAVQTGLNEATTAAANFRDGVTSYDEAQRTANKSIQDVSTIFEQQRVLIEQLNWDGAAQNVNLYADAQDAAEAAIRANTDAAFAQETAQRDLNKSIADGLTVFNQQSTVLAQLGLAIATDETNALASAQVEAARAAAEASDSWRYLKETQDGYASSTGLTVTQTRVLSEVMGTVRNSLTEAENAFRITGDAQQFNADKAEIYRSALETLYRNGIDPAKAKVEDWVTALGEAEDKLTAQEQATERAAEASKTYADNLASVRDVQEAFNDGISANEIDGYIEGLKEAAKGSGDLGQKARDLIKDLEGLKTSYQALSAISDVARNIAETFDTTGAQAQLDALNEKKNELLESGKYDGKDLEALNQDIAELEDSIGNAEIFESLFTGLADGLDAVFQAMQDGASASEQAFAGLGAGLGALQGLVSETDSIFQGFIGGATNALTSLASGNFVGFIGGVVQSIVGMVAGASAEIGQYETIVREHGEEIAKQFSEMTNNGIVVDEKAYNQWVAAEGERARKHEQFLKDWVEREKARNEAIAEANRELAKLSADARDTFNDLTSDVQDARIAFYESTHSGKGADKQTFIAQTILDFRAGAAEFNTEMQRITKEKNDYIATYLAANPGAGRAEANAAAEAIFGPQREAVQEQFALTSATILNDAAKQAKDLGLSQSQFYEAVFAGNNEILGNMTEGQRQSIIKFVELAHELGIELPKALEDAYGKVNTAWEGGAEGSNRAAELAQDNVDRLKLAYKAEQDTFREESAKLQVAIKESKGAERTAYQNELALLTAEHAQANNALEGQIREANSALAKAEAEGAPELANANQQKIDALKAADVEYARAYETRKAILENLIKSSTGDQKAIYEDQLRIETQAYEEASRQRSDEITRLTEEGTKVNVQALEKQRTDLKTEYEKNSQEITDALEAGLITEAEAISRRQELRDVYLAADAPLLDAINESKDGVGSAVADNAQATVSMIEGEIATLNTAWAKRSAELQGFIDNSTGATKEAYEQMYRDESAAYDTASQNLQNDLVDANGELLDAQDKSSADFIAAQDKITADETAALGGIYEQLRAILGPEADVIIGLIQTTYAKRREAYVSNGVATRDAAAQANQGELDTLGGIYEQLRALLGPDAQTIIDLIQNTYEGRANAYQSGGDTAGNAAKLAAESEAQSISNINDLLRSILGDAAGPIIDMINKVYTDRAAAHQTGATKETSAIEGANSGPQAIENINNLLRSILGDAAGPIIDLINKTYANRADAHTAGGESEAGAIDGSTEKTTGALEKRDATITSFLARDDVTPAVRTSLEAFNAAIAEGGDLSASEIAAAQEKVTTALNNRGEKIRALVESGVPLSEAIRRVDEEFARTVNETTGEITGAIGDNEAQTSGALEKRNATIQSFLARDDVTPAVRTSLEAFNAAIADGGNLSATEIAAARNKVTTALNDRGEKIRALVEQGVPLSEAIRQVDTEFAATINETSAEISRSATEGGTLAAQGISTSQQVQLAAIEQLKSGLTDGVGGLTGQVTPKITEEHRALMDAFIQGAQDSEGGISQAEQVQINAMQTYQAQLEQGASGLTTQVTPQITEEHRAMMDAFIEGARTSEGGISQAEQAQIAALQAYQSQLEQNAGGLTAQVTPQVAEEHRAMMEAFIQGAQTSEGGISQAEQTQINALQAYQSQLEQNAGGLTAQVTPQVAEEHRAMMEAFIQGAQTSEGGISQAEQTQINALQDYQSKLEQGAGGLTAQVTPQIAEEHRAMMEAFIQGAQTSGGGIDQAEAAQIQAMQAYQSQLDSSVSGFGGNLTPVISAAHGLIGGAFTTGGQLVSGDVSGALGLITGGVNTYTGISPLVSSIFGGVNTTVQTQGSAVAGQFTAQGSAIQGSVTSGFNLASGTLQTQGGAFTGTLGSVFDNIQSGVVTGYNGSVDAFGQGSGRSVAAIQAAYQNEQAKFQAESGQLVSAIGNAKGDEKTKLIAEYDALQREHAAKSDAFAREIDSAGGDESGALDDAARAVAGAYGDYGDDGKKGGEAAYKVMQGMQELQARLFATLIGNSGTDQAAAAKAAGVATGGGFTNSTSSVTGGITSYYDKTKTTFTTKAQALIDEMNRKKIALATAAAAAAFAAASFSTQGTRGVSVNGDGSINRGNAGSNPTISPVDFTPSIGAFAADSFAALPDYTAATGQVQAYAAATGNLLDLFGNTRALTLNATTQRELALTVSFSGLKDVFSPPAGILDSAANTFSRATNVYAASVERFERAVDNMDKKTRSSTFELSRRPKKRGP